MTEHTDPQALDAMWTRSIVEPMPQPAGPSFLRRVWTTIKEDLFGEPYEVPLMHDAVSRRIRIHEKGTAAARKLRKLDPEEARETLAVAAMLLGFESVVRSARRASEAHR